MSPRAQLAHVDGAHLAPAPTPAFGPGAGGPGGRSPAGLVVVTTSQSARPAKAAGRGPSSRAPKALRAPPGPASRPPAGAAAPGRTYTAPPPVFDVPQPRYIGHCAAGDWHLKLLNTQTGEAPTVPYRCGSWRHHGSECQRKRAQQEFARVRVALQKCAPGSVALMVLTLARPEQPDPAALALACRDAYRELVSCWTQLHRDITRQYGEPTGKRYRSRELKRKAPRYVATVEAHRDGWPHLNVLVECPPLAAEAYAYAPGNPHGQAPAGRPKRSAAERWLRGAAVRAGFGPHATITRCAAEDTDHVAGYVTKWEADDAGAAAEVTKVSQLPLNAPRGMRRMRASVRFLPPAKVKHPDWTGELVREPMSREDRELHEHQEHARQERKAARAAGRAPERPALAETTPPAGADVKRWRAFAGRGGDPPCAAG